VLLLAVLGLLAEPSSFGTDDGAYGGQVHALLNGSWTLQRPLPVVDEANEGWLNAAITPDGPLPYTTNPAWAEALTATVRVGSALTTGGTRPVRAADHPAALAALPVAGAVASAAAAWLVAARFDRRAAPLAFWLVALGPTLVNATTLWAHTVAAAGAGLAAAGLVAIVDRRPGQRWLVPVTLAVGAATVAAVTRTESALWIGAMVVAAVMTDRRPSVVAAAGAVGGVSGLAFLANRMWSAGIRVERLPVTTSVEELNGSPGWLAGRLPAAWHLMASGGSDPAVLVALVGAVLAGYGAVRIRTGSVVPDDTTPAATTPAGADTTPAPTDPTTPAGAETTPTSQARPDHTGTTPTSRAADPAIAPVTEGVAGGPPVPVVLGAAAVLYAVFALIGRSATISGLAAAWPAGVVLLVAGRHRPDPRLRFLALTCGFFTLAVTLTQYSSSGGLQWGGRYLSPALVPLAALAALAGRLVWDRHRRALAALLVAPAVAGAATSHHLHQNHHAVVAALTASGSEVVITENPAIPRLAWTALPVTAYRADAGTLHPLLGDLASAGVETVTVHGVDEVDIEPDSGYRVVETTDALRHLERIDETASG
jgi:hypothetical protein